MPTSPQNSDSPTKPVNLRIRHQPLALIDRAAQMQGRSRSDFMIEAARQAAEEAILDQQVIVTDKASYDRFIAILDAPPQANDALRATMRATPLWEKL